MYIPLPEKERKELFTAAMWLFCIKMLVASSNKILSENGAIVFSKSFIYVYIKKRNGPRLEPCGTPIIMSRQNTFKGNKNKLYN